MSLLDVNSGSGTGTSLVTEARLRVVAIDNDLGILARTGRSRTGLRRP
jgi:hypothetical protein